MQTPPPPLLSRKTKAPDRFNKTPFSGIPRNHQPARNFESELQPNRVSSRFQINERFCNTGHRLAAGNLENPKSVLVARLQKNLLPQIKKPEPIRDNKQILPNIQEIKRHPVPVVTTTKQPQPTQIHKTPSQHHHHQILLQQPQPTQLHKTQTQHHQQLLLQQTGPNQQVGLATATKPPLSVSQYTQPTPLPANRSNHQLSRTHSEPNQIPTTKYSVTVNGRTYKILRKIGSGGSAKVYEGFESQRPEPVAIKIINLGNADARTRDSYFNEQSLLKKLRDNRYVVRIYDSQYNPDFNELVLVMEKGDVDLSSFIDSFFKDKIKPSTADIKRFIKYNWGELVRAVDSIHQYGIVHADLKPVNFILVKGRIRLIDFGIASSVDPEGTSIIRDYQIGTINYMAPESLRNRALDASMQHLRDDVDENNQQKRTVIKYNSKADIWSLGCILYNLVYGRPPFDDYKDVLSKVQAITDPRHVINFPDSPIADQNLLICLRSCLRYNPADRPTALELLNGPYLAA